MRISTKFISCSVVLWAAIAYAAAGDDDYYGNPEPAPTPAPAPGHWPAFISYHSVFINVGQQDEVSAVDNCLLIVKQLNTMTPDELLVDTPEGEVSEPFPEFYCMYEGLRAGNKGWTETAAGDREATCKIAVQALNLNFTVVADNQCYGGRVMGIDKDACDMSNMLSDTDTEFVMDGGTCIVKKMTPSPTPAPTAPAPTPAPTAPAPTPATAPTPTPADISSLAANGHDSGAHPHEEATHPHAHTHWWLIVLIIILFLIIVVLIGWQVRARLQIDENEKEEGAEKTVFVNPL